MTIVVKHQPKPEERAARLRMQAVAKERVIRALPILLEGLDAPTQAETCHLATLAIAKAHGKAKAGGSAVGSLAYAMARVCPAYRSETKFNAAEALFKREGDI